MRTLREQFQSLQGRVCLICVGNPGGGDDALGVRLGHDMANQGLPNVVIAGTEPERFLARQAEPAFDHLVFIDAVDFGGAPGSIIFLDSNAIVARFPQVSTHQLSLGILAKWAESNGVTKAWLVGVQPESLRNGQELSPAVEQAVAVLNEMLMHHFRPGVSEC